jgi:hypothetical protein
MKLINNVLVVKKAEFPDPHCYCCNAKYRDSYPKSMETRRIARQRKKQKELVRIPILNMQ